MSNKNNKIMENQNNTNTNTMEQNNIFAGMDNAVKNFFGAIDEIVTEARKLEERKMVFVLTRTAHYEYEDKTSVKVIECLEFSELAKYGIGPHTNYLRAKFKGNHGHDTKWVEEMSVGTILKIGTGEYLQRIK